MTTGVLSVVHVNIGKRLTKCEMRYEEKSKRFDAAKQSGSTRQKSKYPRASRSREVLRLALASAAMDWRPKVCPRSSLLSFGRQQTAGGNIISRTSVSGDD